LIYEVLNKKKSKDVEEVVEEEVEVEVEGCFSGERMCWEERATLAVKDTMLIKGI